MFASVAAVSAIVAAAFDAMRARTATIFGARKRNAPAAATTATVTVCSGPGSFANVPKTVDAMSAAFVIAGSSDVPSDADAFSYSACARLMEFAP